MKVLGDIAHLSGVRVLVRVDFNVPIKDGVVLDDFRIRSAIPTIKFLRTHGAKVILMSHLEDVRGGIPSLAPVAIALNKLKMEVSFAGDWDKAPEVVSRMREGECVLLENLRYDEGEKKNSEDFAKKLASLGDIYVNDAFSVCHREHASLVGVPKIIPGYAGLQVEKEVENLSKAFHPDHPFLFIMGGAKFETKMPLIQKFISLADDVFVGGALANDLLRAKGYEVGVSVVSKETLDLSSLIADPRLIVPSDVTVRDGRVKPANGLNLEDKIMDIGPKSLGELAGKISRAKFILWNGPMGLYEDGYRGPTLDIARMVAEATGRGVTTIVGGGDTAAAIAELKLDDKFTFISTAGGAMLDFLAKGSLPGVAVLG